MVHQLLAGVHIVVAAEALALAAKAGVDVQQLYDIVKGAAGSSWMFCDRGKRMIDNKDDKVMSALAIFYLAQESVLKVCVVAHGVVDWSRKRPDSFISRLS